ncbi:MAG: ADP-ribosylglycohydrolase family protein, partial [Massilia sp.]
MRSAILAFTAGAAWRQTQLTTPDPTSLATCVATAIAVCVILRGLACKLIAVVLLGAYWAALLAHSALNEALPLADEDREIAVNSGVASALELSPAICKRTFSYTCANALVNMVSPDYVELLPDLWLESLSLSGNNDRIDMMQSTVYHCMPILHTAARLYYDGNGKDNIITLYRALIEENLFNLEESCRNLTRDIPDILSIREISESSREERGKQFQALLNAIESYQSSNLIPACAFFGSANS